MTAAGDKTTERVDELEPLNALIEQLERSRTTSASTLRRKTYDLLAALGVDVRGLVHEAREVLQDEARRRAKHASRRREVTKLRLQKNAIPPEKIPAAMQRLEAVPRLIRTHKAVIEEIANRPPIPDTDPTRERQQRAPDPADKVLIQPPDERWTLVKRFNWPVDQIERLLTGPEYEAADKYRWAYEHRISHPKVSNYDGAGGGQGDPSRRLPVTPTQQQADREWQMWERRVPPALQPILDNFVLERPRRGMDRPMSRAEFGKLYGQCQGAHQARGISDGMLKVACGVLAAIWAEYQDWLEAQRSRIRAAAENETVRAMIAQGALDDAAREIQAMTRAQEAAAARGVAPVMARNWIDGEVVRRQTFGQKQIENTKRRR